MSTIELTGETLEEQITKNDIVLVDFWAEWCGPCRMFGPVFESASERHPDVVFGKVDTEAEQALAAAAAITSIPTLMVFRSGVLVYREAGAHPAAMLEELIQQVRAIDPAVLEAAAAEQS